MVRVRCTFFFSFFFSFFCVLTDAQLVEVKSGDTYNGTLVVADAWMNILLRNVVRTNKTGDKFWQLPEIYIRGSRIKYICVPDDVIDLVPRDADTKKFRPPTSSSERGRGG